MWRVWQISALVCRPHLIGGHRLWSRLLQSADTSLALHLWALHCSVYSAETPKLVKKSPITSFPSICILVCVAQCDCSKCCIDTQKCRNVECRTTWTNPSSGKLARRNLKGTAGNRNEGVTCRPTYRAICSATYSSRVELHIGLRVELHLEPILML